MSQLDEDEAAVKEARDAAKHLKELREHPGWLIIKRVADAQIKARIENFILLPRRDMADEWEKEFQKGEVAGMKFILALLEQEIETNEAVKDALDARREQHAATGESEADDTGFDRWKPAEHGIE